MKKLLFGFMLLFLSSINLANVQHLNAQTSSNSGELDLGDYKNNTNVFAGNRPEESIGINVDVKYGRSQEIIKADELASIVGKQLTQLDLKLHNEQNYEQVRYTAKITVYITPIKENEFVKGEDKKYHFMNIDREKDCVLKDFNVDIDKMELDENGDESYEFKFKFTKPYIYNGGNLLLTIETQAESIWGEISRSFCACYSYPQNVKGLPITSLCAGSDRTDVTQPGNYEKKGIGKYRDRTSKLFHYEDAPEAPKPEPVLRDTLEIDNPTAGQLQEQISQKEIQFVKVLTLSGNLNQQDLDYLYASTSITHLHLENANIESNIMSGPSNHDNYSALPNLMEIYLPESLTEIGTSALSAKPQLKQVVCGHTLQKIGMNAFARDAKLENIQLGNAIMEISASAFTGCSALSSISIPESVTTIGASAFSDCIALKRIHLPNSIKLVDRLTFSGCTGLDSVYLQSKQMELSYASFNNCTSLKAIKLESMTPPPLHKTTFKGINNLHAIKLYIPYQAEEAYRNADIWKQFNIIPVGKPAEEPKPGLKNGILELGDFANTNNCFDASIFQLSPINVDYTYSKSQEFMLADELESIKGKEITQINYRLKLPPDPIQSTIYEGTLDMYISTTTANEFKPEYKWIPVDTLKDKVISQRHIKIDAFDLVTEKDQSDYILTLKLDKPYLYEGGNLIVSFTTKATNIMTDGPGRSFADFYCYPENAKGKPFYTACTANDKQEYNFTAKLISGEYGILRHRAVKQLLIQEKSSKPDGLKKINDGCHMTIRNHSLTIKGVQQPNTLIIYDFNGKIIYQTKIVADTTIQLPANLHQAIVKLGSSVKKISL